MIWLRRDLRLHDSAAVHWALQRGLAPLFAYVFDDRLLNGRFASPSRTAFMLAGLRSLQRDLEGLGGRLVVASGQPEAEIARLARALDVESVVGNRDYSPYARVREARVESALEPIPLTLVQDRLLVEPWDIESTSGKPYTVYTPFKTRWRSVPKSNREPLAYDLRGKLAEIPDEHAGALPALDMFGMTNDIPLPAAGEDAAADRLSTFLDDRIFAYRDTRNRLADPFDANSGTSSLSPYIRWGMTSPRQIRAAAADAYREAPDDEARASVVAWMDEIIWHEFYTHILWHFPDVTRRNFNSAYDGVPWRDAGDEFDEWAEGRTGFPVVDAAMRQLSATGWMHNRARMIVASFLTKDLLIHWRHGEAHFMRYLLDGDIAPNNGGWQWAASTGTDAQPYFRIFNPVNQSERFDPDGSFIRRWVPELADVPAKYLHAPWEAPESPRDYPPPMVDHRDARLRALNAFKGAKS
ncbi:MAG: deoxyribodipyrimidine photo-lyase [Chloroflexi bacterium]|nr:deoxyribodipyrimidine photo-lyase [Chloroflexota bacterium]